MKKSKYIYGFQKVVIDLWLILRLYFASFIAFGFFQSFVQIKKYLNDNRNLLNSSPKRYLKSGKELIVVPDMAPVNSKIFIQSIIKDIKWLNLNKQPDLLFAIICITSRCPFNCKYCYNSEYHTNHERLDVSILINAINELIKSGIGSIYLSGGEPMMRINDLLLILNTYKNTNTRFWLLTTGYDLDIEKLTMLKNSGLTGIMVSLDSNNAEQINKTKGNPEAFNYSVKAIKQASSLGLIVAVDYVLGKSLLKKHNFSEFIRFVGNNGGHFVNCYSPKQMQYVLDDEYNSFDLEDFKQLDSLIHENNSKKSFKKFPLTYSPDLWEAKRGCVGGKLFIYIDPEGNVKICPFVSQSFGNITEVALSDILNNIESKLDNRVCNTNQLLYLHYNKTED